MFLELALDKNTKQSVGYCLSIIVESTETEGEIESLYILPGYRKMGIGDTFMQHALEWLDSKKVSEKRIVVASGNEEVFSFYGKYKFYPRFTTLVQK